MAVKRVCFYNSFQLAGVSRLLLHVTKASVALNGIFFRVKVPFNASLKQSAHYFGVCSELCRKGGLLESDIKQLQDELLTCTGELDQLEMEKASLEIELLRMEATHNDKERDYQVLVKDFEYAKERETVLMVDRSVTAQLPYSAVYD